MANRFPDPNPQFADETGTPYAGGFLYFFASETDTELATYSDADLDQENDNPIELDSAGRAGSVFLQNLPYKVVLKDADGNQIWTLDPVYASDYSTIAQFAVFAGNPNGSVAGTAGSGDIPSSVVWDNVNNILYVCTSSGTAGTAVWTAVNSSSAAAVVPPAMGYLTPTSATPVITADTTSSTIYYTPYVGELIPIYSGAAFVPTTFAELSLSLVAQHAANTIYDCFVFNNGGAMTLVTGPGWSSSTAGSGSRGTGAGTTQLSRISGVWVNAVSMTGRNGSTTHSIGANLATYVGSIFIDAGGGAVTCNRSWGQSRKWGIWNAYNRVPVFLKAGDSTSSWTYNTSTVRASNGSSSNSLTVFAGLAEEYFDLRFGQYVGATGSTVEVQAAANYMIGIGVNSTTSMSGRKGTVSDTRRFANGTIGLSTPLTAGHMLAPALGIQTITCLESTPTATSMSVAYNGGEDDMILSASWRA